MTESEQNKAISINFTRFPQNLLIPSIDNTISFQAINYFNNQEKFKFDFEGENINIHTIEELSQEIHFGPGETKHYEIKLIPTADGYGTLTFTINWLKRIEYTVKVKKVRQKVSKSQINKILAEQSIAFPIESDKFNPENYILSISSKEIKQAEKELKLLREMYESEPNSEMKLEDINKSINTLAKAYLSEDNPIKALEYALEISNETEKLDLYYNLIRAYGSLNLEKTIELIKNLTKNEKRTELIKNLAMDQVDIDPEQAPRIAYLIEDASQREELMINIIGKIFRKSSEIAIKIAQILSNELLRIKILFTIIKEMYANNKSRALEILTLIINIIEKSNQFNLSENNFNNSAYQAYKDSIVILAELDSTQAADNLLISFELRNVKDKVAEDLFDVIYEMVDETRIRFDPVPVFSQYYIFNTFISGLNEDIKQFSMVGGNVSNNILLKDFSFTIMFMSLFSYDFSIFPLIDRLYTDLKYSNNKSIAYYIYPSKENHIPSELKIMNNTMNQFGLISNLNNNPNKLVIFNLDFIPYLGKPTIIVSSNPNMAQDIITKVRKNLQNDVNIKIDNNLFKGGKTEEYLQQLYNSTKCELVNLILSYEFINSYEIFKAFTLSLI